MKVSLFTVVVCCCVAACLANPAINEVKNGASKSTGDPKGRFLTLPVANKCANRE